jgi:UDPglucose 6-dehydrogenase
MLQARGARIRAYDPQGRCKGEELLPGIEWCEGALDVADGADVLVVLTEWNEFRAVDLKRVRELMSGNVLVDLRNIYAEEFAVQAGFIYHGVGRTAPAPGQVSTPRRSDAARQRETAPITH